MLRMIEDVNGDVIEKVTKFSYLVDVLNFGRGVQDAVTAGIRSRWKKFRAIASILCKRVVSLKQQASLCEKCLILWC